MDTNNFIKQLTVGPLEVNCYLLGDLGTKDACLIDPGAEANRIRDVLRKGGFALKFIINTHGHGDHIAANGAFGVPIYIHRLDGDFLRDPVKNLSRAFLFAVSSPAASRLLEDGDIIKLGGLCLEIIHTPGHTPGSISVKAGGTIFTGDALFKNGIGRTDLDYGDEAVLLKSIKQRLLVFSDDTVILPGHGESSTIGEERRYNPFLK
ncbi:MAG: MBL fold metallo-hydrolase [Candidatus Omnitrophota bacterium]|nr:MBL fold metallo-hydrolase [Candidatus Omnitrophota bacterium]